MPQGRNVPKREAKKPKKTEAKKGMVSPETIVTSEGVEVIGKRRKRKNEDF